MYKSVSFNIFDLHLEDIVYRDRTVEKNSCTRENASRKLTDKNDMPIPKPIDEFWKKPLSYSKKAGS
jgi:hypothetical protein